MRARFMIAKLVASTAEARASLRAENIPRTGRDPQFAGKNLHCPRLVYRFFPRQCHVAVSGTLQVKVQLQLEWKYGVSRRLPAGVPIAPEHAGEADRA